MKRGVIVLGSYLVLATLVLAVWARATCTETVVGKGKDGEPHYSWANLTKMIDGTAPSPFVTRRLLPDSANFLSQVVPECCWNKLKSFLDGESYPARRLRGALDDLGWKPEHYPQLFSGYFLIWLSIIGFMFACRQLARFFYDMPDRLADVLGGLFGIGLLGGNDGRWSGYTYDFPHAFLFVLCVYGIVASRWWLLPTFILACYSKETALLLIIGYAVVHRQSARRLGYWLVLAVMYGIYINIRTWINEHYQTPPGDHFWFPERNLAFLAKQAVYNMWWLFIMTIVCARIYLIRREVPRALLWLLAMGLVILGAAFFKGWIEERRQYLEVYPIVGLIVWQWAALELGVSHLFRPRVQED
jgi:hypothetical protein